MWFGPRLAVTHTTSEDICNKSSLRFPLQCSWTPFESVELSKGHKATKPGLIHSEY